MRSGKGRIPVPPLLVIVYTWAPLSQPCFPTRYSITGSGHGLAFLLHLLTVFFLPFQNSSLGRSEQVTAFFIGRRNNKSSESCTLSSRSPRFLHAASQTPDQGDVHAASQALHKRSNAEVRLSANWAQACCLFFPLKFHSPAQIIIIKICC